METKNFINQECQKNNGLDKTTKANVLLKLVNSELQNNISSKTPLGCNSSLSECQLPNQSEYALELRVIRYFLYDYTKHRTIEKNTKHIFYPNTPKDKERFNAIRDYLQTIFE